MKVSEIVSSIIFLGVVALIIFLFYGLVTGTSNARASYEYGLEIGEKFCAEHNGQVETVPHYQLRNIPNQEPSYIECKEIHNEKIHYNRYELVKGNYYLVEQ